MEEYEFLWPSYRLSCLSRRITYAIGHILNDLSMPLWRSYILLYMYKVVQLSHAYVGYMVLMSLVVGALWTPLVVHQSDRRNACFCYTKRKSWHLLGTILVGISLPFLFMQCIRCEDAVAWEKLIYYTAFMIVFHIGWTTTQTNHLKMIPEITYNEAERVELNAVRYTFSVVCAIATYTVLWLLLTMADGSSIGPKDAIWFRALALTLLGTGLVCALLFHCGAEEHFYDTHPDSLGLATISFERLNPTDWLKEPQFYQTVFLYVFTHLSVTVSQMYLPIYLIDTLGLRKEYVAAVPLVAFLGGMIVPFATRPLGRCTSSKVTAFLGLVLLIAAAVWLYLLAPLWSLLEVHVFGVAAVLGAGGAVVLVSALDLVATLVGDRSEAGNFVYATLSFLGNIGLAIAILTIQQVNTCGLNADGCSRDFYRDVMSMVGGGAAGAALLVLLTLLPMKVGRLRNSRDPTRHPEAPVTDGQLFLVTPVEDCFNFWSCLSTSREPEAHMIVIVSTPTTQRRHVGMSSTSSNYSVNDNPSTSFGQRNYSYETLPTAQRQATLRASRSAPTLIEHSGTHTIQHSSPEITRHVIKNKETANLIDNEEEPEPTSPAAFHVPAKTNPPKQVTVAVVESTQRAPDSSDLSKGTLPGATEEVIRDL